MNTTHLTKQATVAFRLLSIAVLLFGLSLGAIPRPTARAATPGLPFTEDFSDTALRDSSLTNANWSTDEQALVLTWRRARYGAFGAGLTGSDVSTDTHTTTSVALGDVDGDGDLDLVAGNSNGQVNRLYLNDGTGHPFNGVDGNDVSGDTYSTWSVALGDVDGDGDLDLVAGNDGQANRLYLNDGSGTFGAGGDVSSDAYPTYSVALGDMDGDGDLDLVAGNDGQANRLYLNDGSGTFGAGGDVSADTHSTQSVALGDVDGDGDLDLVAGNGDPSQANRLYLNNGSGTFSAGSDISADAHDTWSVALGDVDGDGDLDLVAGNDGQANRLYLNDGTSTPFDGTSGNDISTDTNYTTAVALGDVDDDGDLDLVTGNAWQANRLYLNDGSGAFGAGSDITTDDHETRSVVLGDVDEDGDLDLVAGNFGEVNRLYLNNGTASPFSGVTGSDITTDDHYTRAVAMGDVDGDRDLDLVTGNDYGQVKRLYLNNGTANPFNGISSSSISTDTHQTFSLALGDVDSDGDLDLVAGSYGFLANRLYLNDGTASPFSEVSGSDVTTDTHWTLSVALGDVDGDGDLDLVAGNYWQASRLYLNAGTANPFSGVTGSDVSSDTPQTNSVALGDVDGDGDLDLVAGNDGTTNRLYLNAGGPTPVSGWAGYSVSSDVHNTRSVALGDVDKDGDLDLVAGNYGLANRLYLNNGTPNPFSSATGSNISSDAHNTTSVALGDVDGDGDLDLIAGNAKQTVRLYLNDGSGTFGTGSDVSTDKAYDTFSVVLGDVDGDGDLDLVAGNGGPGQVNRLYLNNGSGIFGTGSDITADAHLTTSVILGDVNGDGDLDLIAGNYGQANRLYLNNGKTDPFNGVSGSDVTADADNTRSVALGDVDGDGDLDLVAGNANQTNRLYLNTGKVDPFSGISGSDVTADIYNTYSVALGDVDRDGDLDLAAGNSGQVNRLYLNDGSGTFAAGSDVTNDGHQTYSVALEDVSGDGDLDLVAGNADRTNLLYQRVLYHTGQGQAGSLTVDTEAGNIDRVMLVPTASLPPNTHVTYWLSNNGGAKWFIVQPGVSFVFPTTGTDLRWRAELYSLSPVQTPRIDQILITKQHCIYLPLVLKN